MPEDHKSLLWGYFTRIAEGKDVFGECKSKNCGKKIKCHSGSTSSLRVHLRSFHPILLREIETAETARQEIRKSKQQDEETSAAKQPKINDALAKSATWEPSHPAAKAVTKNICRFIALGFHAYSIVEEPSFRDLLRSLEPRYIMPVRTSFSRTHIPKLYLETKAKVQKELAVDFRNDKVPSLSFTSDIWTSCSNESYISFCISYTTSEFEMKTFGLENKYLPGSHTGETILESIEESMNEWDLRNLEIPVFCVRDNGSNIKKAFRLSSYYDLPCFAHTLQLAIKDAKEKTDGMETMLGKCKHIVSHYHHSSVASERLTLQQKRLGISEHDLIIGCPTRWNSDRHMVQRLLEQKEAVSAEIANTGFIENLTTLQWKLAQGFSEVLAPFDHATVASCGQKYPTRSMVIPILYGIENALQNFITNAANRGLGIGFAKNLKEAMLNRFPSYKTVFPDNVCTLLDPRFKTVLFSSMEISATKSNAEEFLKLLETETGRDDEHQLEEDSEFSDKPKTVNETVKSVNETGPASSNNTMSLWAAFDQALLKKRNKTDKAAQIVPLETELQMFQQEDLIDRNDCPLKWWRKKREKYPTLNLLARAALSIPATQVQSERLNSTSGNVATKRRGRLLTEHVSELTFLHENLTS